MSFDNTKPLLLFDGVCNLCNASVQFVIKYNAKKNVQFSALQSETGQAILKKNGLTTTNFDTIVLLENDTIYTKSTAALRLCRHFDGFYRFLYIFIIVPTPIRNFVYSFISKNRYRWFGKEESCWLPTPDLQKRFV
ncbi:MAG: thiol-disulfide oxidoreductase DCC family protein [Chitinophagales bacterium]